MTNPRALPRIVIASLQLLKLLPILQTITFGEAAITVPGLNSSAWPPCSLRNPLMDPTYEKRHGTHIIWQIPPNPKGVLYMAQGGGTQAGSYFDPGPNCHQCFGMPEIRRTVLEALRRGYAAIVVMSLSDSFDCKWPLETSPDLPVVTAILKEWMREHALDGLPLAGMAVSSGGSLLTALTTRLPMRAIVIITALGMEEVLERATPQHFPPTFFVEMPRDGEVAHLNFTGKAAEAMVTLKERGVEVAYAQLWTKPLDPLIFSERILCIDDEMSLKVFKAFESVGWLDGNGFLLVNPQHVDFGIPLRRANVLPVCTVSGNYCLINHVQDEARNFYAIHGHSSDADDAVFAWLDSMILRPSGEPLVGTM